MQLLILQKKERKKKRETIHETRLHIKIKHIMKQNKNKRKKKK